ncbi:hypothetical protein W02_38070 [Nitrospira sp. KM1]|uniref:hypothetical protein n=1 Tax=Nitrospira sp. KM1 TaxID=1936990 RepID=UPI0013A73C98|nr:hypothetical protein [Nitrospira sp. KM1]BCA56667.1 hypothetical protein W02_38070 [Nitrospira sp. KM1]
MSARVDNTDVKARLFALYDELITHDGYAEMRVEIRLLKRGQKEIIIHCGKQYRFVVDCPGVPEAAINEETMV